ncbi:S-layer homology domain-containing protein [Anaerobacillus isosaccharinicus]|uniref:S-layer homology domain-containing protein n=1 Tax=Anaerobacillus isosaccharinicus TaxID=1532552 RepID=A0A1S2M6S7_9BACI|nr:S-layer homology domain-containing protein [Anaerobacillus isosaccharinicus]MBA5584407.1 S-layer homology domain-containing protein [Anaerobacillus isosaccharinicus]QOY37201.1 S-layer homology domain-containing protein [Anaerobacillus isosaccharinicus]
MKKISFLLALVFLLAIQPLTVAADDITGHRLEKEMREMAAREIMQGYSNGKFGPDDQVTRGQFALLIYRALKLPDPGGAIPFIDVSEGTELELAIRSAYAAKIINGYNDTEFRPGLHIERQQMAAMIYRALQFKEIEGVNVPLTFSDTNKIAASFLDAVAYNTHFKIIQGHLDGRFAPTDTATRAHAAAFIFRMLNVIEKPPEILYEIGSISNGQLVYSPTKYKTFAEAQQVFDPSKHDVIVINDKVLQMKEGIAYTRPAVGATVSIFPNKTLNPNNSLTYLPAGAEMKFIEADGTTVKVQIADTVGFVSVYDVNLVPKQLLKGQSYYRNIDGRLFHYVYVPASNHYVNYSIGPAPEFVKPDVNARYYSWDGITFYDASNKLVGVDYQYFTHIPLRTKTAYTAEELNRFVRELKPPHLPESPLAQLGEVFIAAQEEHNVNALYLLAKAIHESNWGTSAIAREKYNLFGYKAVDSNPGEGAATFESYEACIRFIANFIKESYISPRNSQGANNWRYNGALLGNKTVGINVRYASDPYWGQKIAGHMYRADRHLGGLDTKVENRVRIGIVNTNLGLNVRSQPVTTSTVQFSYPRAKGYSVLIVDEVIAADGVLWYKILSDHPAHEFAYVYGNGPLGQYVIDLSKPLVK